MKGERLIPTLALAVAALAIPCAQTPVPSSASASIVGVWTLNKDLSDAPLANQDGRGERGEGQRRSGGYGRRGGGFGGGGFGGGAPQGGDGKTPEEAQRMRNALRDELQAADHLTIIESGTTLILTAGDGRTTRLSLDGKKIKDESTNVERKSKRDGGKVVSEVTGLGNGKITETYTVDLERKQLRMTLEVEGRDRKATVNRVYDADPG
jgi:hypothetical protein